MSLFKSSTKADSPLDGSDTANNAASVSDFLTVQSFANFAAMTGAITAAWHGLQRVVPEASSLWVPYAFALAWAIISFLSSWNGLKVNGMKDVGAISGAIFIAFINSLVLASAVVGTNIATNTNP